MRNGDWFMLKGTNWQLFFMGALAMIWLWHNKWIHDENFVAPMDPVTHIRKRVQEASNAMVLVTD
jgi:hypothetical protein